MEEVSHQTKGLPQGPLPEGMSAAVQRLQTSFEGLLGRGGHTMVRLHSDERHAV